MRRRRLGLALVVAPLAAPCAVWLGALARGLGTPRAPGDPPNSVLAALVILFAICMFAAPLAYAATFAVLWPALRLLGAAARPWWTLTLLGAVAGGALMPVYLRMLDPRGSWDFFPGVGFVAGAASGFAFWYFAAPAGDRATAEPV